MFGTETVAVRRRAGTDADGRPLPTTTPVPAIEGCIIEPLDGAEQLEVGRTTATADVRVLLPITAGLDGECELRIRGHWYRIVGGVESFVDEDPELSGYQVSCTRGGA